MTTKELIAFFNAQYKLQNQMYQELKSRPKLLNVPIMEDLFRIAYWQRERVARILIGLKGGANPDTQEYRSFYALQQGIRLEANARWLELLAYDDCLPDISQLPSLPSALTLRLEIGGDASPPPTYEEALRDNQQLFESERAASALESVQNSSRHTLFGSPARIKGEDLTVLDPVNLGKTALDLFSSVGLGLKF